MRADWATAAGSGAESGDQEQARRRCVVLARLPWGAEEADVEAAVERALATAGAAAAVGAAGSLSSSGQETGQGTAKDGTPELDADAEGGGSVVVARENRLRVAGHTGLADAALEAARSVARVRIPRDRSTQASRGVAFVWLSPGALGRGAVTALL